MALEFFSASTRAVIASRGGEHGALVPPLHTSTTFVTDPWDDAPAYQYQRVDNPTRSLVTRVLSAIEGCSHAYAFASGMAASVAALSFLRAGDHVIVHSSIYGGTHRFASQELPRLGVDVTMIAEPSQLSAGHFTARTRMLVIETPTNPTLRIVDIRRMAALAHAHESLLVVDNTFMTSLAQRPLDLGADLVIQSATKFMSGHSDLSAGILTTDRDDLAEALDDYYKNWGSGLDPAAAHRLVQSLKTMPLRFREQERNARLLADALRAHPAVHTVMTPGWFSDEEAQIHAGQASGAGSVIAVEFAPSIDWRRVVQRLKVAAFAVSLGDVSTLVCHPASSTHEDMSPDALREAGISTRLVRISVGIEDSRDIVSDFIEALEAAAVTSGPLRVNTSAPTVGTQL